jgi:hypothetical protein
VERIIHPERKKKKRNPKNVEDSKPFEWENSVFAVAKEFGVPYDEVIGWNILLFNYRCSFLKFRAFEGLKQIQTTGSRYTPKK